MSIIGRWGTDHRPCCRIIHLLPRGEEEESSEIFDLNPVPYVRNRFLKVEGYGTASHLSQSLLSALFLSITKKNKTLEPPITFQNKVINPETMLQHSNNQTFTQCKINTPAIINHHTYNILYNFDFPDWFILLVNLITFQRLRFWSDSSMLECPWMHHWFFFF